MGTGPAVFAGSMPRAGKGLRSGHQKALSDTGYENLAIAKNSPLYFSQSCSILSAGKTPARPRAAVGVVIEEPVSRNGCP